MRLNTGYVIPYTDAEAWEMFPRDRWVYNKLLLHEKLGYPCGPAGICPPEAGEWFVKPIYNLNGMGVGVRRQLTDHNGDLLIPPGTFWSPVRKGHQTSVDYLWSDEKDCWISVLAVIPHFRYDGLVDRWEVVYGRGYGRRLELPFHLADCKHINVESIGPHIVELHLRWNPDFRNVPEDVKEALVVWEGDERPVGGTWRSAPEDADGFLPRRRVGFVYR